jgi:hypothetical protein
MNSVLRLAASWSTGLRFSEVRRPDLSISGGDPIDEKSHAKARRRKDSLETILSLVRTPLHGRKCSLSYRVGTYPNNTTEGRANGGKESGVFAFVRDGPADGGVRAEAWLGHSGA